RHDRGTVQTALPGIHRVTPGARRTAPRRADLPPVRVARAIPGTAAESTGQTGASVMSANSQDIRAWAAEQGIELGRRGAIPKTVTERYEAEHNGTSPEPAGDDTPMVILPDGPETPPEPPGPPVTPEPPPAEPAPVAPRQDRRGLLSRRPPAGEKKTRKTPPRVSVADLAGMAYSGIGYVLSRNPVLVPAARSMDIMAPVAGELIDEQIKGTVIDR